MLSYQPKLHHILLWFSDGSNLKTGISVVVRAKIQFSKSLENSANKLECMSLKRVQKWLENIFKIQESISYEGIQAALVAQKSYTGECQLMWIPGC